MHHFDGERLAKWSRFLMRARPSRKDLARSLLSFREKEQLSKT